MKVLPRRSRLFNFAMALLIASGCSSASEPVAESGTAPVPTVAAVAASTPAPDPAATDTPTSVESPTAGPEPVYRGVLQEQHCVAPDVAADRLSVHSGPSTDEPVVTTLVDGQCRIFLTEGEDAAWYAVVIDVDNDEFRGWIRQDAIAPLRAEIDPDAPTVVITINVQYELDLPSSEAPIETFRLVDADGFVVGFLDANGQIPVPTSFPTARARIEAEWADDPYCAWSGGLSFEGSGDRYTSLLEAICA